MHGKMLERLVFFSDAVFAIAITLLVIELKPPHVHIGPNAGTEALQGIVDLSAKFVGFFVSFFVIGAFWAGHHRTFGLVGRHEEAFVWPNLRLLAVIAFLPFSTAFMSENYGQLVPHLFYLFTLLAAGLFQAALVHRVLRPEDLAPDADPQRVAMVKRRVWAVPIACLLGICVCFVEPAASTVMLLATPLFIRLLARD